MRNTYVYISLMLCVTACSGAPSDKDGLQALSAKITNSVKGVPFEVKKFDKTNGQAFEVVGLKGYRLFYSAVVSFPEGFRPECVQQGSNFSGFNCMLGFAAASNDVAPQPKGAVVNYTGQIEFQNSERGWLYDSLTLQEQSKVVEDDTQTRLSNSDTNFLSGKNWANGDGYLLLFRTPSASTKQSATNVTAFWGDFLEKAGANSYKIEWYEPSRIMVCVQNNLDPQGIKKTLMENSPGANDLTVIAQLTFMQGKCDYSSIAH